MAPEGDTYRRIIDFLSSQFWWSRAAAAEEIGLPTCRLIASKLTSRQVIWKPTNSALKGSFGGGESWLLSRLVRSQQIREFDSSIGRLGTDEFRYVGITRH